MPGDSDSGCRSGRGFWDEAWGLEQLVEAPEQGLACRVSQTALLPDETWPLGPGARREGCRVPLCARTPAPAVTTAPQLHTWLCLRSRVAEFTDPASETAAVGWGLLPARGSWGRGLGSKYASTDPALHTLHPPLRRLGCLPFPSLLGVLGELQPSVAFSILTTPRLHHRCVFSVSGHCVFAFHPPKTH